MIYIINLPGDVQRRQRMDDLLRPLNLPFKFVEAIRGVELSAKDISLFDQHQTMELSPGEIGCILSHAKVWNMICNSDDDFAVILEDGARRMINKSVDVIVTSVHQTTAGKMIFGRVEERADQPALLLRHAAAAGRGESGGQRAELTSRMEPASQFPKQSTLERQARPVFPGPDVP